MDSPPPLRRRNTAAELSARLDFFSEEDVLEEYLDIVYELSGETLYEALDELYGPHWYEEAHGIDYQQEAMYHQQQGYHYYDGHYYAQDGYPVQMPV
jgi:hypothetical protein